MRASLDELGITAPVRMGERANCLKNSRWSTAMKGSTSWGGEIRTRLHGGGSRGIKGATIRAPGSGKGV